MWRLLFLYFQLSLPMASTSLIYSESSINCGFPAKISSAMQLREAVLVENGNPRNPLNIYHSVKNSLHITDGNETVQAQALHRACLGLIQLQRVYHLALTSLAKGCLAGIWAPGLASEDFFIIGSVAVKYGYFAEAVRWLRMAGQENDSVANGEPSVLAGKQTVEEQKPLTKLQQVPAMRRRDVWDKYTALCRGHRPLTNKAVPGSCSLQAKKMSYGYWKKETVSSEPEVILFHDVIQDNEINRLITRSQNQLWESRTVNDNGDESLDSSRISKTVILENESDKLTRGLSRRVEDLTGLRTEVNTLLSDSETFHISYYEPGGVYEPHYDVLANQSDVPQYIQNTGDRIATFMFYLSEVEAGGSTVFPLLDVRVPVVKGGAAFWYNLKPDGSVDRRTLHAGCPVLLGSKWIANKWIHEKGQMFTRPCV